MYKAEIFIDGISNAMVTGFNLEVVRREIKHYAVQYINDFDKTFEVKIEVGNV